MNLQGTYGLQYAHLMMQKTKTILIEERIVMKSYVRT